MIVRLQSGFSLIEVVIVIAIVGILASIAIPSYQSSIERSRRAQGQAYLLDIASRQERFYTQYGRYADAIEPPTGCTGADCELNITNNTSDPDGNVANGWYTATITATNATYTVQVEPENWTDTLCGNLTYNNRQEKGRSVTTTPLKSCWR